MSRPPAEKIFLVTSDAIGEAGELGRILMRGFLTTLERGETLPSKMIFLNAGVRLTTREGEVEETLAGLAARGVEVLSCGTCLDYYGLKGALRVGLVTTMHDTVAALTSPGEVVTVG